MTSRCGLLVLAILGLRAPPVRGDVGDLGAAGAAAWRLTIQGETAWNAPLGGYGLSADADPLRLATLSEGAAALRLAASAGVGMDVFNDQDVGARWAFMPRLRLVLGTRGRLAVSLGAGLSSGRSQAFPGGSTRADGELSVEGRWDGGLAARAFGGVSATVDTTGGQANPFRAPYLGLALGYAFVPNPEAARSLSIAGWYGWQSLALDAIAAAIPAVTDRRHEGDIDLLGYRHLATRASIGVYLVSGPSVHGAHHRWARAAMSAGGRLLLPLVLGVAGHSVRAGDESGDRAVEGAVLGAVLAALADAAFLGWEPAPAEPGASP